ncbi:LysR family transcriptional regulator [Stappia sp. GBMRC 2046]|uniref:LysR family transcriptional regulator n=1 Tax=Stappia sediminis TaxID=2692190 RepID=A0A7X3LVI7_9HYPH|nr:LysR substrate-binding domain-containing protein [Stappia sediminis]MXN65858.1 LysR family transcriptional regulator [Stappia sediminis]
MPDRKLDIGWPRIFASVARLGSITHAAAELGLSQPAVSYQIKRLEEEVGVRLLHRLHRGIALTEEGEILFKAARAGVELIDEAAKEIRKKSRLPAVRLFTDYGFASFWLMPRVAEFRRRHSDFEVHIIASQAIESDIDGTAEIAVMFGQADEFSGDAQLLMPERVVPVCAPNFKERFAPFDTADAIATAPLLHLDTNAEPRWLSWEDWLAAQGVSRKPSHGDLGLNTYSLVIQAALAEQGIALGWLGLVDSFLENGSLVRLGPELERKDSGYWLITNPPASNVTEKLSAWLVEECQ